MYGLKTVANIIALSFLDPATTLPGAIGAAAVPQAGNQCPVLEKISCVIAATA